eukprot:10102156-Alexandrium_andersonii.AAC.1
MGRRQGVGGGVGHVRPVQGRGQHGAGEDAASAAPRGLSHVASSWWPRHGEFRELARVDQCRGAVRRMGGR